MDTEQLRDRRFDRTLDAIAKRERTDFRRETFERRQAESQRRKAEAVPVGAVKAEK